MAEFKKLSDVEVVSEPAESANVLIEENGVIKKAPKTAVGRVPSWNNLIDKPFYENVTVNSWFVENEQLQFTGKAHIENKRVDWIVPDKTFIVVWNGVEYICTPTQEATSTYIGDKNLVLTPFYFDYMADRYMQMIAITKTTDTPETVTYSVGEVKVEIKTIDEKFLPKAAAVTDVTDAPTAEHFNALLTALRNAGYLAT